MPGRMADAVRTILSCLVHVCSYLCGLLCCLCLFLSYVLSFLPFMLHVHMDGAVWILVWYVSDHICIWYFMLSLFLPIVCVILMGGGF